VIRKKRKTQLWTPTVATTAWAESTLAEQAWVEARGATLRWAIVGVIVGVLVGLVAFAPASWLAGAIASASGHRLVLADSRGSVWAGSAVVVLTGGPDSRDATYLPGRLEWKLAPRWYGVDLAARHDCCLNGTTTVQIRPGLGRVRATLVPRTDWIGQWPSAWLAGLGTPWNTLQLGGSFRLLSPGATIESVEGRWRLDGRVELVLSGVSSRLTTLDTLGSYRVVLSGTSSSPTLLTVTTQDGPLQLSGNGTWGPGGVKFRGEARAEATDEAALSNLLNIIGRRDRARSIISIG
jgi:general secretion pathway protein N